MQSYTVKLKSKNIVHELTKTFNHAEYIIDYQVIKIGYCQRDLTI